MRAEMATGIYILSIMILVYSCDSVNANAYHGNGAGGAHTYTGSYGEEEGSGYYHQVGPQYSQGAICDTTHRLGHRDTYPIYNFPPEPQYQREPKSYQQGPTKRGGPPAPEQCIIGFETRYDDDCVLQFHSHYYERGDTDCEQQYLLIGDEYSDKRICGFARPPRRFISSGRRLYLARYRRNGYKNTMPSSIGGVVRCVRRPHDYEQEHTGNEYASHVYPNYSNSNGSTGGCPPQAEHVCKLIDPQLNVNNNGFEAALVELSAPPEGPNPVTLSGFNNGFQCSSVLGCTEQTRICYQIAPVGCNVTAQTVDNPITIGQSISCTNTTAVCGQPGPCEATGSEGGSGVPPIPIDINCTAAADQICTFALAFCLRNKTP